MKPIKGQRWLFDDKQFYAFIIEATSCEFGNIVQIIRQPADAKYKIGHNFYIGYISTSSRWSLLPLQDKELIEDIINK
jgi:hypothetical protein